MLYREAEDAKAIKKRKGDLTILAVRGLSWSVLELLLGPLVGPVGIILGPLEPSQSVSGPFGGLSSAVLVPSWGSLGQSWTLPEAIWGHLLGLLGLSVAVWAVLDALLSRF